MPIRDDNESHRVLLISPKENYLLGSPPLGMGYLLASSDRAGKNDVVIHDENFIAPADIDGRIDELLKEFKPSYAGIAFPSSAVKRVVEIVRRIRKSSPETALFAGGYHPTSEPELTLRLIPELDFIIVGEAEHVFPHLGSGWKTLENVAYLEGGEFFQNEVTIIKNIDEIPFPDRTKLDARYFRRQHGAIPGIYAKVATLMTSRGCPYSCSFCSCRLIQKKVRFHGAEHVVTEIEHILDATGGIDCLWFIDVMFLTKWSRVDELCGALIGRGFHKRFKWAATVSADSIDDDKVKRMKEAGCFYLSFGFESNSPRVLKAINKKATPEDNKRAVEICGGNGIYVNSAFLFGIPGEEEEDLRATVDFVKENNVHFTGVNLMKPLPGSPFYYEFVEKGMIRPSIEEWHSVSSIHIGGEIYNDKITREKYLEYIEEFNAAVGVKGRRFEMEAHKKLGLAVFIKYIMWKIRRRLRAYAGSAGL